MGALDNVFAGKTGIANALHKMLGAPAVLRKYSFVSDPITKERVPQWVEIDVFIVPEGEFNQKIPHGEMRGPSSTLTATITSDENLSPIQPECDSIVYNGIKFLITSCEAKKVGVKDYLYAIKAERA